MKKNYTYSEARLLLKSKLSDSRKGRNKTQPNTSIKAFCELHNFKYQTVVNCLNEEEDKYPKLIKDLLAALLDKPVQQKKVIQYSVS